MIDSWGHANNQYHLSLLVFKGRDLCVLICSKVLCVLTVKLVQQMQNVLLMHYEYGFIRFYSESLFKC